MRICIIASPRSGSTSFSKGLSKVLNLKKISEPHNDKFWDKVSLKAKIQRDYYERENKDNIVVKTMTGHRSISFFVEYVKTFDKVILLTRKNIQESYESFIYRIRQKEATTKFDTVPWHTPYYYDLEESPVDEGIMNLMKEYSSIIYDLNKILNVGITYYEDLFSEDINKFHTAVDNLNLKIDKDLLRVELNPKNRYRQFKKQLL